MGDLELVELQHHRNDWYVRRARVLLQQRAAEGRLDSRVAARLREIFSQSPAAATKLRALWALHVTRALPQDGLVTMLDHPEPYIRAWAVQLLCEDAAPGARALDKFASMARNDAAAVVRLYLASALQRLAPEERWPIAEGLVTHAEDIDDHNLPKMIWFGVEPLVAGNTTQALALASRSEIPMVTQFVARRATAARRLEAVADALGTATNSATQQALLEGLRDGLTSLGRRELAAPKNWAPAESALLAGGEATLHDLVRQIGQLFGDAKAAAAQLATLKDASAPPERRSEILRAFARDAYAPALEPAIALLDDARLRRDAIRALAAFDDPRIPKEILRRYATWTTSEKAEAILTLAARRAGADVVVTALKSGAIPKQDISAFAARQLQRVAGPAFVDVWGPIAQPAADKQADMFTLKRLLTDETLARADLSNGRAIFERTCASCHMLYGQGGTIGPDITGSNRANLDYILTEIINPSEVIQEGYQLITLTTRDGRTLAGNLVAEDEQQVTLRMIGQDSVVVKSEILAREKLPVSMMPEGLLKMLSPDEVRDLIGYLRTTQQVPLAKPPPSHSVTQ
jgi:putative heme-binding domain-containing protein